MEEIFPRVWDDLMARTQGPMWFRLILQPLVAIVFGIRAGLRNARVAQPGADPSHTLDPAFRSRMLRQSLHDVGKVALIGVILDVIVQLIVLKTVYPLETFVIVLLLVAVPYQIVRTVVGRFARKG